MAEKTFILSGKFNSTNIDDYDFTAYILERDDGSLFGYTVGDMTSEIVVRQVAGVRIGDGVAFYQLPNGKEQLLRVLIVPKFDRAAFLGPAGVGEWSELGTIDDSSGLDLKSFKKQGILTLQLITGASEPADNIRSKYEELRNSTSELLVGETDYLAGLLQS
jgi:hypothetical protein